MENLLKLFDMLTSNDTQAIKFGYKKFTEIYGNKTQQMALLCEVLFSKPTPDQMDMLNGQQRAKLIAHRQLAGILLRKSIRSVKAWEDLSTTEKRYLKLNLFKVLMVEEEKDVRKAIINVIAIIVQHENDEAWFGGIVHHIIELCIDEDLEVSKNGGHMFLTLCESASASFKPHMHDVCGMFYEALTNCEKSNNYSMPVMLFLFEGMSHLVNNIIGNNLAEEMVVQIVPTLLKALHAFTSNESTDFAPALSFFEMLSDYCSELLCSNLNTIVEFCLHTIMRIELDVDLRARVLCCINNFMHSSSMELLEQNLFESIVSALFFLIAKDTNLEPEEQQQIDYYLEDEEGSILPTALRSFELLAHKMPAAKLMPQLFSLFSTALDHADDVSSKRAIYLVIGSIASGIECEYTHSILNLTAMGMQEHQRCVRNAAYFAFKECNAHLASELSPFAPKMLLILLDEMRQMCIQMHIDDKLPQYGAMFFESLDLIMMNMELDLYLHNIVEHLFETLNPILPHRIIIWGLSALSTLMYLVKRQILPYKDQIVHVIKQNLLDPTEICSDAEIHDMRFSLGLQAIETLGSLIRHSGLEKTDQLIEEAMGYSLILLNVKNAENMRSQIFSLISSLAQVAKEDMRCVFPEFIEQIFAALKVDDDEALSEEDAAGMCVDDNESGDNAGHNEQITHCELHMEAIYALKEFCKHTGSAFFPYLERSLELTFNLLDSYVDEIVDAALNAVPQFLRVLHEQQPDKKYLHKMLCKLMPKMITITHNEGSITVVSSAIKELTDLLIDYKANALPTMAVRNELGKTILSLLNERTVCQDNQNYTIDCDYDMPAQMTVQTVLLGSLIMVPAFGNALSSDEFTQFFAIYCPQLMKKLDDTIGKNQYEEFRAMGYNCLAECLPRLKQNVRGFFDVLVPKLIEACNDNSYQIRQNAISVLGELVYYTKDYSYGAYPIIIDTLQKYMNQITENVISDKLCGCVARLIIVNVDLVPMSSFIPVLMQNTPLQEHFGENFFILKCFDVLRQYAADIFNAYFQHILSVCIQVMHKHEYVEDATHTFGYELLCNMQMHNALAFNNYIAGNQNAQNFLNSLKR